MVTISLFLNGSTQELKKTQRLGTVPRQGELVLVKGYGSSLRVDEIHYDLLGRRPKIHVFLVPLLNDDIDKVIGQIKALDPSWRVA
jgi:hypothetical protein